MAAENKEDIDTVDIPLLNVNSTITVTREYKVPMAKLNVSGTMSESTLDSEAKIVQRALIFVIDRSYSMIGERISMVKNALIPFIESLCDDPYTIIKMVLFNNTLDIIDVPRLRSAVKDTIQKKVYASGGTSFHDASKGLVNQAALVLKQYPNYQLTVIMCSDGEVSKDNAKQGHTHWKQFVNESYLKVHQTVPYVETIGISSAHDADVLDGFIIDDAVGNYCKCNKAEEINDALQRAQNKTMTRGNAIKLSIEFPLNVSDHIYGNDRNGSFSMHDLVVTSQGFSTNFWISMDVLDHTTKCGDMLQLMINGKHVPITINKVRNNEESQYEAIDYYNQVLQDMLHTLRNIRDAERLKVKAKEIEHELNNEYVEIFKLITAEPLKKRKLQNEIKQLLSVSYHSNDDDNKSTDDGDDMRQRRAKLMKQYKKMNKSWKRHHGMTKAFQNTLSSLKALVREIILGQVRIQEIRQHILDLHFRKKHAKRMEKLILTDEQLLQRQVRYDNIIIPTEEECQDISDGMGTGCYLSTLSFREVALEGDSLWMTARINRSGGVAVSNPELVHIEYISTDLVSDSYFRMALEASSAAGFADSCRELINTRIFPIYGNAAHFKATVAYINEVLSHTLSGRNDIHVVDYNALWTAVGYMICNNEFTTKNIKRILYEMKPSLVMLSEYIKCKPFKEDSYAREPDTKATYLITLAQKKRMRICKFIETFKARTTAWVSEVATLFADRLMNMDCDFNHEFYLSAIMHRLRIMFNLQCPKQMDDMNKINVEENHKKLLQILICGDGNDTKDTDEVKEMTFLKNVYTNKILKKKKLFAIPNALELQMDFDEENMSEIKESSMKMLVQILSRVDVRDLIKGHLFFETLCNIECDAENVDAVCEEFSKRCTYKCMDKIPNDLNVLFNLIGWKVNVNVLRAICCISILFHRNRAFQNNVEWFGDDMKKQIMNDPESVLKRVYSQFVIKHIRFEYKMEIERKNMEKLRECHTNPILPDDIDEYGNLPYLRCAWKRCAKIFDNRDQLLNHVRYALYGDTRPLLHGFHVRCADVLSNNPNISVSEFKRRVRNAFSYTKYAEYITLAMYDTKMEHYFNQFKGVLQQHSNEPRIASSGNMYYFDKLAKIQKN